MIKLFKSLIILIILGGAACTPNKPSSEQATEQGITDTTAMLVDSVLYFRHHNEKSDILSRYLPDITREQAIAIQLALLEKELAAGAQQVGWKIGGTATADSASYDPVFGYMLDKNWVEEDSIVAAENFPGGQVMVEGEVGFVMKNDLQNGVSSLEELKDAIDYVVGAVEFAQAIAIPIPGNPSSQNTNHVLASGMGHAGVLVGSEKAPIDGFDMENETVKCFINGELAAEGISSKIFHNPLNALYSLANLLPKYGTYLKKGDVIVTGSLYTNPTIDSTAEVRLEYSTLGTITFSMQ